MTHNQAEMPHVLETKGLCRFYVVRHGQTQWNVEKRMQGHQDSPLTELGLSQAKELAQVFKDIHFSHVFSSDLLRAKRTAEIIVKDKQLAVLATELLREKSFGQYEGKRGWEYERELRHKILEMEKLTYEESTTFQLADGIETEDALVTRLLRFIRETALVYKGEQVLVVSHSGCIRSLLVHLGFGTNKELSHGAIKNLGYFVLDTDGVDFFIRETSGIEKRTI